MKISRHARHNMRLYGISTADIVETITKADVAEVQGERQIAIKYFKEIQFPFPLKVVYCVEKNEQIVVTVYPLRQTYFRRLKA